MACSRPAKTFIMKPCLKRRVGGEPGEKKKVNEGEGDGLLVKSTGYSVTVSGPNSEHLYGIHNYL